jgi:ABC-type branched-subunit amino acid transport system substrate-binding protein
MNFVEIVRKALIINSVVFVLFQTGAAWAERGITSNEIRIGSTGAMSGSIAEIGGGMAEGARVYYDKLNASGGLYGRKIFFFPKDDVYDPVKAVENVKGLVENEKIFALIGGNGTPIAQAIAPTVRASNLIFGFTQTGGALLYANPPEKSIFQLRMSYADEASSLVKFAVSKLGKKSVGIFYQDDAYGVAGRAGVEQELSRQGLKVQGLGTYQRNSLDVDKAVDDLIKAKPDVVYMQSVAKPTVEFLKKCVEKGFKPIFMGPSPLGSIQMQKLVGSLPIEVYFSEILPSPVESDLPLIKAYQKDMAAAGKKNLDYFTLEGYVGALVFSEGLRRAGKNPTKAGVIDALEKMKDVDIGGLKISFSPKKHFALDQNFIVHLKEGQLKPISK